MTRVNLRSSLYALLGANAISWHGSAISQLAIPWFVLASTGSPAQTGLAALGAQLGGLGSLLLAARWVDALGYRRASVVADLCCALAVTALPVLALWSALPLWVIVGVSFVRAFCDAPGQIARASLIPDLTAGAGMRLEAVNTLSEVLESGSGWSGPLLAGFLIAALGALEVQWLDAASFLISAGLVAVFVPGAGIARASSAPVSKARPGDAWAGWRFLLSDAPLRAIYLSSVVFSVGMAGLFAVMLPVVARQAGALSLGVLVAAFGAGAVLGALAYGRFGQGWSQRRTFLRGVWGLCGIFAVLALTGRWQMIALGCFIGGLVAGPNGPMIQTLTQQRTPAALRARVFAAASLLSGLLAPLGVWLIGLGVEGIGLSQVALGVTLSFAAAILAVTLESSWGRLERAAQPVNP